MKNTGAEVFNISSVVQSIASERNMSEELALKTIEDMLIAAYKRTFGDDNNAFIEVDVDTDIMYLYARKEVMDENDIGDPVLDISLEEAQVYDASARIGDMINVPVDLSSMKYSAVQVAKQRVKQGVRDIQSNTLYAEFSEKEGEIIIGYVQQERNKNLFINLGKVEGILPKRFQSPREMYHIGDRVRAYVHEVKKSERGVSITLSRTHPEFVKKILEANVPEIYDKAIEIIKVVREPGYRTKIAVYTHRNDLDPVGTCVGMKGTRIQSIINELDGERIDILKYSTDPYEYIRNALTPAQVNNVYILNEDKRHVLVVVDDEQLSLAIGKHGLNVRLANRLVDWHIDVKTQEQVKNMDLTPELSSSIDTFFTDVDNEQELVELLSVSDEAVAILEENNIIDIADLLDFKDKITILPFNNDDRTIIDMFLQEYEYESEDEKISEEIELIEEQSEDTQHVVTEVFDNNKDVDDIIELIEELPGITAELIAIFRYHNFEKIEDILDIDIDIIRNLERMDEKNFLLWQEILNEIDIMEDDDD